jgi:hypothetical protein
MFGGILGLPELILLAVMFGLAVVLPVTLIVVVVYCLRRDSQKQDGV